MTSIIDLKSASPATLASIAFYAVAGVVFLVLLPFANYPPHIGLTAVTSLIASYALFTKRRWAKWLIAALFFVVTAMSLYTIYLLGFSNLLVSAGMLLYAVLTWYFTYYAFIKKI